MNRLTTFLGAAALTMTSTVYAGSMSNATSERHTLFTSLDAAYTWPATPQFSYYNPSAKPPTVTPNISSINGWGARFAVGARHYTSSPWSFTGEGGWGWYGYQRYQKTPAVGSSAGDVINAGIGFYGLDLLFGATYEYRQFDIFAKIGGLIEQTLLIDSVHDLRLSYSSVVPEVSVGGVYNLTNQIGIDLAYYYVFGGRFNYNYSITVFGTANTSYTPTPTALSILSFGLHYKFA